MRLVVVGDLADVTGFALAGIPGIVCVSEPEARAALDGAAKQRGGVVVVSAAVAALAPAAVEAARARREGPLVLILPAETGERS